MMRGISLADVLSEVIAMSRDTAPRVFRSILCPVDFSPNSRAALRYAAMLARLSDAYLVVLFVDDPLLATTAATRRGAATVLASTEDELRHFVSGTLRNTTPRVSMTLLTRVGKPAPEIVSAAARHGCDVIVMGYRGIGRASRFLFGSTTEKVVRTTAVPVLAIPPARRGARLQAAAPARLKRAS
jgi:nucleotide-binding universal stress UspA family protein